MGKVILKLDNVSYKYDDAEPFDQQRGFQMGWCKR